MTKLLVISASGENFEYSVKTEGNKSRKEKKKKAEKKAFKWKMRANGDFVSWQTFGSRVVSFTEDPRNLVTPLTQVTDRRLPRSRYKWLDGDCNIHITSRRSVPVAMIWLKTSGLRPHDGT